MKRRQVLAGLAGAGVTSLAGCVGGDDGAFEPDISETLRLGAAEPTALDDVVNISFIGYDTFEEQATVTANSRVHDYIGSILGEKELLGGGVFLSIERIPADEIEGDIEEGMFNRALPMATVVKQRYQYTEDGELLTTDPVPLDTLREPMPRTVEAEVSYRSDQYTAVLPVVVHRYWEHPNRE